MRTLHDWTTQRESLDSQHEAGRYNPATELVCQGHTMTLGAGTADELDVFAEAGRIYVISTNQGLGYVGLQVFENGEEVGDTFIQEHDPNGEYILRLTPIWRAKRLANRCDL